MLHADEQMIKCVSLVRQMRLFGRIGRREVFIVGVCKTIRRIINCCTTRSTYTENPETTDSYFYTSAIIFY